jgi:excisionase family DNA binding protein
MSRVLGCGRSEAYDLIHSGKIRSIKLGRRVLIPTAAIQAYLENIVGAAGPNTPRRPVSGHDPGTKN